MVHPMQTHPAVPQPPAARSDGQHQNVIAVPKDQNRVHDLDLDLNPARPRQKDHSQTVTATRVLTVWLL